MIIWEKYLPVDECGGGARFQDVVLGVFLSVSIEHCLDSQSWISHNLVDQVDASTLPNRHS